MTRPIPFNLPYITGKEADYIAEAHSNGHLAGDGPFTKKCQKWLEENTGCYKAVLTHSCTGALEMAALLCDIGPGDEIIMPSYTFVSTASAFVRQGGVPVFIDIRSDTLNINETLIEAAITRRTKAIVVVHYAGVGCELDVISEIAGRYDLFLIEDAAQGVMAKYREKALGSIGDIGTFSFHETKNIISGEGGALLLNSPRMMKRAEIIRDKGTNRKQFLQGEIDKYTWVDIGSSFLPGEVVAAFLFAQMEEVEAITARRIALWDRYHDALAEFETQGRIRRPVVPDDRVHNGHMYYLLLDSLRKRDCFISSMNMMGINCVFHYIPLHLSPAGRQFGRLGSATPITDSTANRLVRLPMWLGLENHQDRIIDAIREFFNDPANV